MSTTTALAAQNLQFGALIPELLSEIFALATVDQQDNAASYAASSVCRFWRSVALREPRMWTTLVLDFDSTTVAEKGKVKQRANADAHPDFPSSLGRPRSKISSLF